jgi:hypothetical protein
MLGFHHPIGRARLILQYIIAGQDLVTPQYAYALGASFGIPVLEKANRPYVVKYLNNWLEDPRGQEEWKILIRWCSDHTKLTSLVRDALEIARQEVGILDEILGHAKPVLLQARNLCIDGIQGPRDSEGKLSRRIATHNRRVRAIHVPLPWGFWYRSYDAPDT